MLRNRSLAILFAAAVLIAAAGYLALGPVTAEGTVDHKAITGTRSSTSHTIVTITDTGINVKDQEFAADFNASTAVDDALAHKLGVSQSAVSQHLRVLRQAGLVRGERRGAFVHYTLDPDGLTKYQAALQETLGEGFATR